MDFELTTTNLALIIFGVLAAAISILYVLYLNGGIQTNMGGLFGLLP